MKSGNDKPYVILLTAVALLLTLSASCSNDRTRNRELVAQWLGREIVMPEELVYQIQNDTVTLDLRRPDFKVVNYVDSSGCTSCRMKLTRWSEVVDEFKSLGDVDVEVITIVNTDDQREIAYLLLRDNYLSPVAFDPANLFDQVNELPSSSDYHTFLLDADNRVVAIGNPAANPKIKEIFISHMIGEDHHTTISCIRHDSQIKALGVLRPGEVVSKTVYIHNCDTTVHYTLQDIVPSCDCINAMAEAATVANVHQFKVTYTADSTAGAFSRYVDVFYNEKDHPERLTVYGYIK